MKDDVPQGSLRADRRRIFQRSVLTTAEGIVAYWARHQREVGLSVDWAEAHERCWRCAAKRKLQKCHILPRSLGGSDQPSNLVLLCSECHLEAPNVGDPLFIWIWLRAHASSCYGTYWIDRGMRGFEFLFGRKPFVYLQADDLEARLAPMLEKAMEKAVVHFGAGRFNASTAAWVMLQVELELGPPDLESLKARL